MVRDAAPSERARTEVRVDRRVELLSILHRLGGGDEYRKAPATAYVAEIDRTFARFRDHPAVRATTALRAKHGISYDAPIILAVHLDDRLELRNAAELPALDARFEGVNVEAYVTKIREFAAVTDFEAFVARQEAHYARAAATLRTVVEAEDPVGWFDAFFGERDRARYIVVPGLLNGPQNFGVRATLPDGTLEMYQVLGVNTKHGLPPTDDDTVSLLVHEMAHSYVNPLFERHAAALSAAGSALFRLVEKPMRAQAYQNATTMLHESGVRAVTALYLSDRKGAEAGAAAARAEVRRSFVWTHELVALFRTFRKERARYPDFEAFMPRVVAFFDELVKRYDGTLPKLPFLGPINRVFDGDLTVVAPTDPALAAYVKQVHAQLFPRAPLVVSGAPASAEPDRNLVAYGSPKTNAVIADLARRATWKIEENGITLGAKKFSGTNLVLIACWFRHDDPTRGVVVYAGARGADVVGLNSVRHGGTDWLVARRTAKEFEVVDSGDWPHVNGAWVPPY